MEETTICGAFVETCQRHADQKALSYYSQGHWLHLTWNDYFQEVQKAAHSFSQLNIKPGDRVAILANTRFEWAVCDLAIMSLGAVTVPIYQNTTVEDLQYILGNAEPRILICEDSRWVKRFDAIRSQCPSVQTVLVFDGSSPNEYGAISWAEFLQIGHDDLSTRSDFFISSCRSRRRREVATLMYTSGTTGHPKGVILTHEQVISEVGDAFPMVGISRHDVTLSFLPYAHVMGRIEMWGHVLVGFTMAFAQSIDKLRDNMAVVRPTAMMAVPRIFEKIFVGILNQVGTSPAKAKLFQWAMGVGRRITQAQSQKRQPSYIDLVQYRLAQKLVFNSIHQKLGGRLRLAVSGGAPLNAEIAEFFCAVGVLILEGYGLTETTAAIAVNTPFEYLFGTVGKPIGEAQIRIAEDGEILVKSRKVMREYFGDPKATREAIQDGWFHTGDIGEVTSEGFLRITDRKKELLKTAGGKYVAPLKLENLLKTNPYISQVFIYGDRHKYIVALITLNPESVRKFAQSQNINTRDIAQLSQHPRVNELIRQAVAEANSHLASFETIKNFAILPHEFSIESGELTPSLKIKRKIVDGRYKEMLEGLYA